MGSNAETAQQIISAYVRLRQGTDQVFVSYGQMAELIGRPGQQRLLGAPLDMVRDMCRELEIPDVASMVVNAESLKSGVLKPSDQALEKHSGWSGLRKEQARAFTFDWMSYRL